jgi:hypothetical protein
MIGLWETHILDREQVTDLMERMESCYDGCNRIVIALACIRTMATMLGPDDDETREQFLRDLLPLIRSIWQYIDDVLITKEVRAGMRRQM